jgi:hypothetical protein
VGERLKVGLSFFKKLWSFQGSTQLWISKKRPFRQQIITLLSNSRVFVPTSFFIIFNECYSQMLVMALIKADKNIKIKSLIGREDWSWIEISNSKRETTNGLPNPIYPTAVSTSRCD